MKKIYLLILVLVSFLLRFWRGSEFFFWNVDEEIISLTVKRMVVDHIPQLIGFPVPGGIYLGPGIYYIISPFYLLSFMNPEGLTFFSAAIGALTVYMVFIAGRQLFKNSSIGLMAATLYGFSYLTNIYSHLFTGLTFVPLLVLTTYYFISKIAETGRQKYVYGLGAVLIVSSQDEASSLSLLVLALICWPLLKFKVKTKPLVLFALAFIFSLLPLFIFNLRHNN